MTHWGSAPWDVVLASWILDIHTLLCSTDHLCSETISLQKWFASSLLPTAKQMEWLRNNYFLLSLISKNVIQMEAEGKAGNVGLKSRAQTGIRANKSGSESVQTNQILLWTIASWAHYQDGISLWRLPIKNKLEELPTHCLWQNSSSSTTGKVTQFWCLKPQIYLFMDIESSNNTPEKCKIWDLQKE